jgi:lysophospholipase L1-like esterase
MKDKKKKQQRGTDKTKPALSAAKKRIFWIITLLLPVLFFILLETGLHIFNYGGNLDLFIDGPAGYENYLRCNPNVARRYFEAQSGIPTPPKELFLKIKPPNGYRIFVLGGSSAAGFPYGTNVSFPNILQRALSKTFPDKKIEVINVSMAAINSYSLLDFTDEVLEQSPDALLIYAGHNEYYGALGVGSEQSLGNSRWLIHTYLKLRNIKTFLLVRDFIGWIKIQFSKLFYGGSKIDPSATLMERIVSDQTIPYGSRLYEEGKEQFKENINSILQKAAAKNVTVVLSELVCNLRDQEPFISIKDKEGNSAEKEYKLAKQLVAEGKIDKARKYYIEAKDLDALRFRAPEEFNVILKRLSEKFNYPIVPAVEYFEKESVNGIIGNELILEHLHPNKEGYFLLAKAFYETMKNNQMIDKTWSCDCIRQERNRGVTELDSVYAALSVKQLRGGWPFQSKSLPNRFVQDYKPGNQIEDIAFQVIQQKISLETGHMELGEFYENQGNLDKAFSEYNSLVISIPTEIEFYDKAALTLLKNKEYQKASDLLLTSLNYKENDFAYKWIGQIALMDSNYTKAILYLTKADLGDAQVVFNLSRACYLTNQAGKGDEYFIRLQGLSPKPEYISYLNKLRLQTKISK